MGESHLMAVPRLKAAAGSLFNTSVDVSAPFRFQGDLLIFPRNEAWKLPWIVSCEPPSKHNLNFFTDASYPSDNSWGQGQAKNISTPENPAGVAVVWKPWPGLEYNHWHQRTYQILNCPGFRSAELNAVVLGLETATILSRLLPELKNVTLFTDCKYAIRKLMEAEHSCNEPLIKRAVAASAELDARGVRVQVRWCPGHIGICGNEKADALANSVRKCQPPKTVPKEMPERMKEYEIPEHCLWLRRGYLEDMAAINLRKQATITPPPPVLSKPCTISNAAQEVLFPAQTNNVITNWAAYFYYNCAEESNKWTRNSIAPVKLSIPITA
nr:uncharacterized protein CTRU02_03230 [Colletotrichum truncatum]KAF6797199.1 hypothetical protein CTRU02_03230 [Colletotrichum truncatum]